MGDSLSSIQARLSDLERKLRAREGQPGYKTNVEELREAIAALEAEIADREASDES